MCDDLSHARYSANISLFIGKKDGGKSAIVFVNFVGHGGVSVSANQIPPTIIPIVLGHMAFLPTVAQKD